VGLTYNQNQIKTSTSRGGRGLPKKEETVERVGPFTPTKRKKKRGIVLGVMIIGGGDFGRRSGAAKRRFSEAGGRSRQSPLKKDGQTGDNVRAPRIGKGG